MKTIIVFIVFMLSYASIIAQDYTQNGKVFIENTQKSTKKSTIIETDYTWQDKKGKTYKIYLSKNGKAFIKVISKNGNPYNKYLSDEIANKINQQYKVNNKKS